MEEHNQALVLVKELMQPKRRTVSGRCINAKPTSGVKECALIILFSIFSVLQEHIDTC